MVVVLKNRVPAHRNNNNTELWKKSTETQILESIYIIYKNHGRFFYLRLQLQIMTFIS